MITNLIAAVFAVGYLGTTGWLCRGFRFTVRALCLGAIAIAATCVLSLIYIPLPTGASITAGSWLPLILLALTLAVTAGTAAIAAAAEALQYTRDRQKERRRRNGPQKRHHHPR